MKNENIENTVEQILSKLGIMQIPIPLEEVAEALGIRIKRAPSNDFSGLLLRKDGKALIGVNDNESHVRQRFTVAHELGHYFLHPAKDAFVDYRDNQTGLVRNTKEREANMFAAAFLIPKESIISDVKKISATGIFEEEIARLAKKYDVSKESMNYRLLNLGLSSK